MSIKKSRRRYTKEFKLEAVQLVHNRNGMVTDVAQNLGIHPGMLQRWMSKYANDPSHSFPGNGNLRTPDEEIHLLQRRLRDAEEERDILKKALKYQFIHSHQDQFRLSHICKVHSISRSSYYNWLCSKPSKWIEENAELLKEIKIIHKQSRQTYGSHRITKELHNRGYSCSRTRVARIMAKNGICAKIKRKFKVTTDSKHNYPLSPNLLNQTFFAEHQNRIWVSDITYIRTKTGWLYLTVILDLFNRQIVGWSMSSRLTANTTTIPALIDAWQRQEPSECLIFHSDRGVQFACHNFRNKLSGYKIIQSMSGKGNYYDNAVCESFFHTLKTELVYFEKYETREQARQSIFEYIEVFYNHQRLHSALDYQTPVEFAKLKKAA